MVTSRGTLDKQEVEKLQNRPTDELKVMPERDCRESCKGNEVLRGIDMWMQTPSNLSPQETKIKDGRQAVGERQNQIGEKKNAGQKQEL